MRNFLRKFVAFSALMALVLPSVSALAATMCATNSPICCSAGICPMHRRQAQNPPQSKSDCGAMGAAGQKDCSLRACDAAPSPTVTTSAFVLVAPVALRGPDVGQRAFVSAADFFVSFATIPSTPPPRTFAS